MNAFKKYVAEFLGTFTLVFIAAGAVCTDYYLKKSGGQGLGILGISLAYGLAMVSVFYVINYISGAHINPAVTIACWLTKRMDPNTAIKYILFQILGASLAGFVLKVLFPEALYIKYLGANMLGSEVSIIQGCVMEFIISFLFVLTIFGTAIDKRANEGFAGLAIGLVILFGVLIGYPISGGGINPARAFGPAIASGQFTHHFVWWIGPILGSISAALLYDFVFAESKKKFVAVKRKKVTRPSPQKKGKK